MQPAPTLPTKPHYPILDGLRGVAALMVVAFHLFEAHATSHQDQLINHGYLAVDFFFLLSGFVIGYAYDDRWNRMSVGSFFRRRLVRLQPMVVFGTVVGALLYYFQVSALWPAIGQTPVWKVLLLTVLGSLMLPAPLALDIRGWQETYPLNGPGWSLMYEYVANILYAVLVRKFSKLALGVLVALAAAALLHLLLTRPEGDIVGGWSPELGQVRIGLIRVMYPFFAGLLLFRTVKPGRVNHAFGWSSLLVVAVLAMPRLGGLGRPWVNGLYESLSIILVFPLIVLLGASGELIAPYTRKLCKFLGAISYPLYITHYPLIYSYTAWVYDHKVTLRDGLPVAALTFFSALALAYAALKLYDEPVRAWLQKKLVAASAVPGSPQPGVAGP
ncbi:acyltransferase [Hymenobacter sp. RP-2-7]|uniref:Acyltransferase n=1 Tax=Hymenobacter polaris TaxID=2682546 RepID=A0A7Y0FNK7_9BACT|nr:acyltransferase [Hymenobacter polaris]NML66676.1 acyltransferase [Hymenobacter polaris]